MSERLSCNIHIAKLKQKCTKAQYWLRTVSSQNWGAEQETLLQMYRMIVRTKIDYGCIVYGAATRVWLISLEVVANETLRICTGALKTPPIKNLNVLTNEPALTPRRNEFIWRYYFNLRCHIVNSIYNCVLNDRVELFFNSRQYKKTSLRTTVRAIIWPSMPTSRAGKCCGSSLSFSICMQSPTSSTRPALSIRFLQCCAQYCSHWQADTYRGT